VILAVLTVMGLLPGFDRAFGLAPLYGHDVWLHAVAAVAACYVGWIQPRASEPAPQVTPLAVTEAG